MAEFLKDMNCSSLSMENTTVFFDYCNGDVINVNEQTYVTAMFYANLIDSTIICTFFAVFGVVSNVINMVIFRKIGFQDSINMSLFALAISDFCSCLSMFPIVVGFFPWIGESGLPVNWMHFVHTVAAWPRVAFTKITTLITAFIIFERCLCVYMPLKVKTIVTRKRTKWFLVFAYSIVLGCLAPLLYSNQLGWRFVAEKNRTILGLVSPKEREDIEKIILPFFNAGISIFAFIFIIISTIVLVVTLKKQSQWRLGATKSNTTKSNDNSDASNTTNNVATKEQKISRMVVIISSLFICSLFPSVVLLLVLWIDKRFDVGGSLFNLFVILVMVTNTLETVNAAMNIVIYYKNSSNYKAMFDQIFRFKSKAEI